MPTLGEILNRHAALLSLGIGCLVVHASAVAQVLDPEAYINEKGHPSIGVGDDGVTRVYSFTERVPAARIAELERGIARLPKRAEVLQMCDQTRGSVKAKLVAERHAATDVTAPNYGYSGSTVACVLKYIHESKIGTQLTYTKKASGATYTLFLTE